MTASFVSKGLDALDAASEAAQTNDRSGVNTGKFLIPGNKLPNLKVVPLVELNSTFPEDEVVTGYMEHIIYWDAEDLAEKQKTHPEMEGLRPIFSFPMISIDDEIDVGWWLRNNVEVFANAKIKTSSKYKRTPKNPMDKKDVILMPVLWLNKPATTDGNNDEGNDNIYVMKTTQKTIRDGYVSIAQDAGHVKGMRLNVNKISSTAYVVNCVGSYEEELPTELGLEVEDYVGFKTRQSVVDTMALYGIVVPDVPAAKVAELEEIEKMINFGS